MAITINKRRYWLWRAVDQDAALLQLAHVLGQQLVGHLPGLGVLRGAAFEDQLLAKLGA